MVRILQLSDTHISNTYHFDTEAFHRGIDIMNTIPRDIVMHLGDITEHGFESEYQIAEKLLNISDIKFVLGNHDSRNVGYTLFEKYLGSPRTIFVTKDIACATFDSTIPDKNEGRMGKNEIRMLRTFLDEYSDLFTVVAFHHHLLPPPRSGRERGLLTDAGNVLKVILDYRADLVLSAHRHSYNVYKVEDTVVVNSGTFSSYKTRAGDAHSFNLIEKKDGSIHVRRFDIDTSSQALETRTYKGNCLVPACKLEHRIVHLSDSHFGSGGDFLPEVYNSAVKKIVELSPNVLVHAGDVTHDGLQESYEAAKGHLDMLPFEKVVVPGARDYMHLGEELFPAYFPAKNTTIGKLNIIWADSVKFDESEGYIGRRQLRRILDSIHQEMINIVVFHHHIVPVPHTRERDVIEDAGDVLKSLCNKVHLILNGNRHVSFSCKVDGTIIANSNTISSKRVHCRYGNTFNIIDILDNNNIIISEMGAVSGVRRVLGVYSPLDTNEKETG